MQQFNSQNSTIFYGYGKTPFGEALIAFTDKAVCYFWFLDNNTDDIFHEFSSFYKDARLFRDDNKAAKYLEDIFVKNKKCKLLVKGTAFQISVWRVLLGIRAGEVVTYKDIANKIKRPTAVRAVANAIGKNHIAYLIPCHRVIAKNGAISGYRWGLERKRNLLDYESKQVAF